MNLLNLQKLYRFVNIKAILPENIFVTPLEGNNYEKYQRSFRSEMFQENLAILPFLVVQWGLYLRNEFVPEVVL